MPGMDENEGTEPAMPEVLTDDELRKARNSK